MISKLFRLRLNAFGIASLLSLGIHSLTVPVFALPEGPRDSGTPGTPKGNPQPPPSRPEAVCPTTEIPITGLFENEGRDYTNAAQPTFLVYLPYTNQEVNYIKFFVVDSETTRNTIYEAEIKPIEESGIIQISLPPEPQYQLEVGKLYRWYLNIYCEDRNTRDIHIDGWIMRTEEETGNLDYDRIANAVPNPESPDNSAWLEILQNLDRTNLSNQPFVPIELIPIED